MTEFVCSALLCFCCLRPHMTSVLFICSAYLLLPWHQVVFTPATYEGFGTPSQSLLYAQAQLLCKNVPKFINKVEVVRDQLTVFAKRESLLPLMLYLSHHSHTQVNAASLHIAPLHRLVYRKLLSSYMRWVT
jgi:hypothetical protein